MSRATTKRTASDADEQAEAVAEARRAVLAARDVERTWADRARDHRADLAQMRDGIGVTVLDDPDASDDAAREMAELEQRADVADRAVAAQQPRIAVAERAYLEAEAAVLSAEVDRRQAILDAHEARTRELHAALVAHEGPYVPERDWIAAVRGSGSTTTRVEGGPTSSGPIASDALRQAVEQAQRPLTVLRTVLAGENPNALLPDWGVTADEVFPACVWGPDALVAAPAWQEKVDGTRARVVELERGVAEIDAYLAEASPELPNDRGGMVVNETYVRRQQIREELPEQLQQARADLAFLTGEEAA